LKGEIEKKTFNYKKDKNIKINWVNLLNSQPGHEIKINPWKAYWKKHEAQLKKNQVKKMNIINPGNLTNSWPGSWDWDNPIEKNYKKNTKPSFQETKCWKIK